MNTSPAFSRSSPLVDSADQALLTHYLESIYEVFAPTQFYGKTGERIFSFQVGEFVPTDSRESLPFGTLAGAFLITACNPGSRKLASTENENRQRRLAAQIDEWGWMALPAAGRNREGTWVEPSFLVLGATETAVRALMREWGQNAWLWIDPAGQVHLQHHGQCPADPSSVPAGFF